MALLLLGAGCGDQCERLCRDLSVELSQCVGDGLAWPDVGARGRVDFVDQCRQDWDQVSADLSSAALSESLDVCADNRVVLEDISCAELRALYGVQD